MGRGGGRGVKTDRLVGNELKSAVLNESVQLKHILKYNKYHITYRMYRMYKLVHICLLSSDPLSPGPGQYGRGKRAQGPFHVLTIRINPPN